VITASTTFLTLGRGAAFFLDYLAMGTMDPNIVEQVVEGMARACHSAGLLALIGGETAECPDSTRGRVRSGGLYRGRVGAREFEEDQRGQA